MNTLWPIAIITFKEGIRNRAMYGISILALLLFVANFLICGMIMQEVGKVAVDIALSTVSFAGLLLVLFVGINLMAKDLDKRTIYMVLSRPVSRSQYLFGKFFGIILLIVTTISTLSLFAICSILTVKEAFPDYSQRFSWSPILLAILFIILMLVLVSALSFLFASFTSTSFVTLVLTLVSYIIGQSIADINALVESSQGIGGEVSPAMLKLVQTAYYVFPNLSFFDIKIQAAHNLPISSSYIFWTVLYGVGYSLIIMTLTTLIFKRREFP